MCLWFKRKPDVESDYDQRVGNSKITSPIPGAYADPVSPPITITVGAIPTAEPTSLPMRQLLIPEVSQQSHTEEQRDSNKTSPPRPEAVQQAQASQPSPQSQHDSSTSQNAKRLSSSTQFSSHHSLDGSPSPELSPKWFKSLDSRQNQSQSPWQRQSPANSPGHPPSTRQRAQSPQSSSASGDRNSQSPMPVHQAYISPDQLTIGAKLSPPLTVDTPPTTGGLHTGKSQFSHIYGSAAASPIDGRNLWGNRSATGSPIDGRNPWNSHRESLNSTSVLLHGDHTIKEEEKAVNAPWERQVSVAVVPLPRAVQAKLGEAKAKEEARKEERSKMARIHIPIPRFILESAPKKGKRQRRDMSPDTASPQTTTSTKTTEQWPGEM